MGEAIVTVPGALVYNDSSGKVEDPPVMVTSCTVSELFSGTIYVDSLKGSIKGALAIPEYQRPYVWGKKEVSQLLSDLQEYFSEDSAEKPLYYLGSIILHKQDSDLNIIDGQQRITTLAILQSYYDAANAPYIEYASPVSIQNIKRNYASIKAIADKDGGIEKLDLNQINVTLIITHNEDDAYTFFETQNTGGVRLSGVDIIKAHHLKAIESERHRGHYASIWEKQKEVETVVSYLLKARYWGFLQWKDIPSYRDSKGTKNKTIKEFSQKTLTKLSNKAYHMVTLDSTSGSSFNLPPYRFSIRQPLANGHNFIEYLECFCEIYERLFLSKSDKDIDNEFYTFRNKVINEVDGTAYLKEFFEVAMLCYVHRFGVEKLLEAAFWVFRYTYAPRVINEKTVREDSIPAFVRDRNVNFSYPFDHILSSFSHEQLVGRLKYFEYKIDTTNTDKNTVKSRFINRVKDYLRFSAMAGFDAQTYVEDYDKLLRKAIDGRVTDNSRK
jgi:hypothetical protein